MEVNVWVTCQNSVPRAVVQKDMKEIPVRTEVRVSHKKAFQLSAFSFINFYDITFYEKRWTFL